MRSPESFGGDSLHERRYRVGIFGSRAELQGGMYVCESMNSCFFCCGHHRRHCCGLDVVYSMGGRLKPRLTQAMVRVQKTLQNDAVVNSLFL